nr:hypothetical protein [uncultured archaeon]
MWFSETLNNRSVFIFRTPIETKDACYKCAYMAENTRTVMMEKVIEVKERINSIRNKIIRDKKMLDI